MRIKNKLSLTASVLLLVIISIIALAACSCGGYRNFTLKNGIGHFSFEYPSRYEVHNVDVGNIYLGAFTTVYLYTEPIYECYHDAEITVRILAKTEDISNVEEAIESHISYWGRDEEFKIMERSSKTVDGVQGMMIKYYHNSLFLEDLHFDMNIVRLPSIVRKVFFEYKGNIWRITVEGHESLDEILEADFKYILNTFEILT